MPSRYTIRRQSGHSISTTNILASVAAQAMAVQLGLKLLEEAAVPVSRVPLSIVADRNEDD